MEKDQAQSGDKSDSLFSSHKVNKTYSFVDGSQRVPRSIVKRRSELQYGVGSIRLRTVFGDPSNSQETDKEIFERNSQLNFTEISGVCGVSTESVSNWAKAAGYDKPKAFSSNARVYRKQKNSQVYSEQKNSRLLFDVYRGTLSENVPIELIEATNFQRTVPLTLDEVSPPQVKSFHFSQSEDHMTFREFEYTSKEELLTVVDIATKTLRE